MINFNFKKYRREITTLGLVLGIIFGFGALQEVRGAAITGERVLLGTSRPSVAGNHEYRIVVPAIWGAANNTFFVRQNGLFTTPPDGRIDFDVEFGTGVLGAADNSKINVDYNQTANTNTWQARVQNNTLLYFITASAAASVPAANHTLYITIGTSATYQGTGDTQYTNPVKVAAPGTADIISFNFDYNGAVDTGTGLVAIIEGVTVTATVAESLTASISTLTAANCDATFMSEADATMTNTTVEFGTLGAATFGHGCHTILVSTNAANGYTAQAEENSSLQIVSTNTTIDDFNESSANPTTAGAWATPTEGFGYACFDANGASPCESTFTSSNSLFRPFANISRGHNPATFLVTAGPTTTTTRLNYRLLYTAEQTAGAYTNVIEYVFTPTF